MLESASLEKPIMTANLQNPIFQDETKAREWLEARVWATGPLCPHCGNADPDRITALKGTVHRPGLYQCNEPECREQFTVTVGTVFERSKIPLTKWLAALFLLVSSKKGISARQAHRMLDISYKSTWFMMHRLREAMRVGALSPLGGEGKTVETDETFIGRDEGVQKQHTGWAHKNVVLTLVERGGEARSFHVDSTSIADIIPIVKANVSRETTILSDEAPQYRNLGQDFASHAAVNHAAKEYVRGAIHTNTVEGYYSIFKRGMKGVYQHCKEKHLHRYLAEFDFRYSNRVAPGTDDMMRAEMLAAGITGKRLTYRRTNGQSQIGAF
jgi:transposase-like protein